MLDTDERRLIIDIDRVREFDSSLANRVRLKGVGSRCRILQNPIHCVNEIEQEINRVGVCVWRYWIEGEDT